MSDDPKDPREPSIAGWDLSVPLYGLKGMPAGVSCAAGTDYPGQNGKSSFVVHLELEGALTELGGRRLLKQLYRAVQMQAQENKQWSAAVKLGGEDPPSNLPANRAHGREAFCFWMLLAEYSKPVLAFRTHFDQKETLKQHFTAVYKEADGKTSVVRSGWRKEAKVWWIYAEYGYPVLLGRLRQHGFKLKWINRPGFPPAPPVEAM